MAKITDEVLKLDIIVNGNKAQAELQNLNTAQKDLITSQKALQVQKAKLVAAGKKESQAYKDVSTQLKKVSTEVKDNKSQQSKLREQIGLTGLTTKQLVAEQKKLKRQLAGTVPNTQAYKEYDAQLGKVNNRLSELSAGGNSVSKFLNGLGNANPQIGGFLQTAKNGVTALLSPLGLATAAVLGVVAGFKKWYDVNKEILRTRKIVTGLTGETGKLADDIRIRAQVLQESFGVELTDSIETANSLAKNMNISFDEAFSTIENGAVKGKLASGEYLDTLREYPVMFANAGFTAAEFASVVETGIDLGIYSDKLPDAIKEADLALKEQTKSTRDSLVNAFGATFTDDILNKVKKGELTTKDALISIGNEAKKQNLSQQQYAQLTADVFKGAGEDAGGAKKVIEALTKSQENLNKPLSEIHQIRTNQLKVEHELQAVYRSVFKLGDKGFETLLAKGKLFINEFLLKAILKGVSLTNWFIDLNNKSTGFAATLQGISGIAGFVFSVIGEFIGITISKFNHIGTILEGVFTLDSAKIGKGFTDRTESINQAIERLKNKAVKEMGLVNDALNGENKIERITIDSFITEETPDTKVEADKTKKLKDNGNEALTPEDQKILDSKNKLREFLDEWDKEQDILDALKKEEKDLQKEEREVLELENKFVKLEEEAFGETELIAQLEEAKGEQLQAIRDKWAITRAEKSKKENEELVTKDKKYKEDLAAAETDLAKAKMEALNFGLSTLKGFAKEGSTLYKALFLAEQAQAAGEVVIQGVKERAGIAAAYSLMPGGQTISTPLILASRIRTGIGLASIAAQSVKGFEDGKYPITRTDGKVFNSKISNDSGTQLVTEPTFFTDTNRIVGEVDPEIIIDGPTVKQLNPQVVDQIFSTANRVRGFEDGNFPQRENISDVSEVDTDTGENSMQQIMELNLQLLQSLLNNPIKAELLFGYDDLERFEKLQKERNNSNNNGTLAKG